jgi:hypothetical protein
MRKTSGGRAAGIKAKINEILDHGKHGDHRKLRATGRGGPFP